MVCSNNVSVLHHFLDITTFTVYVTVCKRKITKMSVTFDKQLEIKATDTAFSAAPLRYFAVRVLIELR